MFARIFLLTVFLLLTSIRKSTRSVALTHSSAFLNILPSEGTTCSCSAGPSSCRNLFNCCCCSGVRPTGRNIFLYYLTTGTCTCIKQKTRKNLKVGSKGRASLYYRKFPLEKFILEHPTQELLEVSPCYLQPFPKISTSWILL